MKKPSILTITWLAAVVALVLIEAGILTGLISLSDIIANFFIFLLALVTITILAIIGAIFVGMFISHRIFSVKGFTPFEEEMLKMREDLKEIKKALKEKKLM
jgi:hypothetical protein